MNELGYNQLMRALEHFEFKTHKKISISMMDTMLKNMGEGTLRKSAYLSNDEIKYITYRFGLNNGRIKLFAETAKYFEKSIQELKEYEASIVVKIKRYLENNLSSFVN